MAAVNPLLQQIDAIAKEKGVEPEIIISAVGNPAELARQLEELNEQINTKRDQIADRRCNDAWSAQAPLTFTS